MPLCLFLALIHLLARCAFPFPILRLLLLFLIFRVFDLQDVVIDISKHDEINVPTTSDVSKASAISITKNTYLHLLFAIRFVREEVRLWVCDYGEPSDEPSDLPQHSEIGSEALGRT